MSYANLKKILRKLLFIILFSIFFASQSLFNKVKELML